MSKYFTLSLTIVALVIGVIGGYALSGNTPSSASKLSMQGEEKTMPESVDAYSDQQFLRDMIMHHQDAVEMSNRVLVHTSRKAVRDLATDIIDAQTREINQMELWLQEWK
jgi:uncharacterized protein (DUF305 family)